ncbi:MAG: helicase-associated domain-containing protein [Chloroflexi bacterium]|nr:helicase-associated domain-containing protein [Chloroflexota bacterium]
MMKDLESCLAGYPTVMLDAIAAGWGLTFTDETSAERVALLASRMTTPQQMSVMVESLGQPERAALEEILASGGVIKSYLLTRKYGTVRRMGPGRMEWVRPWENPANPLERLCYLGLVYRGYGTVGEYRGEIFFIPPEIATLLPRMELPETPFLIETVQQPKQFDLNNDALAEDIFAMLAYTRREDVRARRHLLFREAVTRLKARLTNQEPERLIFAQHLCRQGGLLKVQDGFLRPSRRAIEWLESEPTMRLHDLFEIWRTDPTWNDLWQVKSIYCEETGWSNDPLGTRERFLKHLARCPMDQWVSTASFVAAIKAADPDFLRPDGDYESWYIRDAESGQYLRGFSNWDRVEGALIRYYLSKPLFWLGAVALGRQSENNERPECFRLTPRGAAWLGLVPETEEVVQSVPLTIGEDFTITASPGTTFVDRYRLERFADWVGCEGAAHRYLLSRQSVWKAMSEGITTRQILGFLRRASGGAVPPSVDVAVHGWGEGFRQVTVRQAAILQTRDAGVMRDLRAMPRLARLLGATISPTEVLIEPRKIAEVVQILREMGFWPHVEGIR